MNPTGKGYFIWKVKDCENGNPSAIAQTAKNAGLTHVLIKIADGAYGYNIDRDSNIDIAAPVVQALKNEGIDVWGWHYVYGDYPIEEADIAIERLNALGINGYVIDAEHEYKEPGKDRAASQYMNRLRFRIPDLTIALSSYRFPTFHPQLPWETFLQKCDYNMPQVYWEQAHNPIPNLERTVREFQNISPYRPVIPTGPTYRAGSWVPTSEDTQAFMQSAKDLNLPAVNFFSWDECRPTYPHLWQTISDFDWDGHQEPVPLDITENLFKAINDKDIEAIADLYHNSAVHITATRTIQGLPAIKSWYKVLFEQLLPDGIFTLSGFTGAATTRQANWHCKTAFSEVNDGSDTLGLLNNKIAYHYTQFSITPRINE